MTRRLVFIGDYSGLSLFLKMGADRLGADTAMYSNGDGWKDLPRNAQLYKPGSSKVSWAWNQVSGGLSVGRALTKDDTLVLATELLFHRWVNTALVANLMRQAGRTVLLHAGCTTAFHDLHQDEMLCRECKRFDMPGNRCVAEASQWPMLQSALRRLDLVIPFTSIYTDSARGYGIPESQVAAPLQFPVDVDYVQNMVQPGGQDRSKAIHGQNRLGFKGTKHLQEMFAADPALQEQVELLPRMNFASFVDCVGHSPILLDQLLANGYGMSGALALATGTSVAFGHTRGTPATGFDGPGCLPVPISGDPAQDARTLTIALREHAAHRPARDAIIAAARQRHDHVEVARGFLQRLEVL
ncbi:hypothetical protein [Roseateles sp. L2-2]|uniref:hypothetical protein n=1 Tax=Roseateles sp. L2-2 TaxID=3422597 RepID=UPI003D35C90D